MAARPAGARWLITGASGFLGANLGLSLAGHGHRIAMTRSGDLPSGFDTVVAGDLANPATMTQQIIDQRPSVIIHAAAMASHEECERDPERARLINADATGLLTGAAQQVGARFVYISTDAVFDGREGHYSEESAPSPTSIYGRTKLEGEEQALKSTDALIIRTNFFGWSPTGRRSILEFFVTNLEAGTPVRGFTDFTTTSAYAPVLADAIKELIDLQAGGIFHVTSPDALTKYEFGVAVAQEFGLDARLITPAQADVHPPRGRDISLDVSKVERTLGRALPTQADGIARARQDATDLRSALRSDTGS